MALAIGLEIGIKEILVLHLVFPTICLFFFRLLLGGAHTYVAPHEHEKLPTFKLVYHGPKG